MRSTWIASRALALAASAAWAGTTIGCCGADNGCGPAKITPPTDTIPKAIAIAFLNGTVNAELATLSAQRTTGLMNRNSIAADSGMIFVWTSDQNPQTTGFFM